MWRKGRFKLVSSTDRESKGREIAARIREAGRRARDEAEARHAVKRPAGVVATEIGGANGPEPTRYGDWERKGLISDF